MRARLLAGAIVAIGWCGGAGAAALSPSAASADAAVVHATEYTADPSAGGRVLLDEWGVPGTLVGRSEGPEKITTVDAVACSPGASIRCFERRTATRWSVADPGMTEDYTIETWAHEDPAAQPAARFTAAPTGAITASGPIGEGVKSWQVLPPGHGTTYQLVEAGVFDEDSGEHVRTKTWVDGATGLPLRFESSTEAGGEPAQAFWTYDPRLVEASDLPAGWMSVSRPENTASDTSAQSLMALPLGPQRDRASGRAYAPFSLGRGFAIGTGPMCFLGAQAVQTYDQTSPSQFDALDAELRPDPYGPLSWVDVDYGEPRGGRCALGDAQTPVRLSLRSMRSDSEMGRAYRAAYARDGDRMQIAVPEPGGPLSLGLPLGGSRIAALVVSGPDGELSSLLDIGGTTVEITGEVTPARLPQLAALLEAG